MKVTIDVSAAINGKAGLGRYAASLAGAIAAEHPGSVQLFANRTPQSTIPPTLADLPLETVGAGYKPWRMAVWVGQMFKVAYNRAAAGSDLYHATEHLLPPVKNVPTVLTVHDLIFNLFPQHHKRLNYWYLNAAMPLYVKRANHVIAISESTKRDLMRLYGTPEEKISVVYEAAAPHFKPQSADSIAAVRQKYDLPDRYLLSVGTIEPRKNLARLVEVLSVVRHEHPNLKLVIAGSQGWLVESFFEALDRFDQRDAVIITGFVPEDDLPPLYAGATVAVLASLYEGFGLPVLEAMACGTPIACSSTSSVGEIAGNAALTFDPECPGEITAALRQLLNDPALCDDLREKGLAHADRFSWQRAARETWAVYEKAINQIGS
ncbi:MAG: glycosyltransferase family 4 protein [Anaerolineae bacterium]|nr:glycosyltransferase family 4 protein [Anaerolineae bacterium]